MPFSLTHLSQSERDHPKQKKYFCYLLDAFVTRERGENLFVWRVLFCCVTFVLVPFLLRPVPTLKKKQSTHHETSKDCVSKSCLGGLCSLHTERFAQTFWHKAPPKTIWIPRWFRGVGAASSLPVIRTADPGSCCGKENEDACKRHGLPGGVPGKNGHGAVLFGCIVILLTSSCQGYTG